MAPLFHQSFDGFSNHYFVQITSHFEWTNSFSGCVSLNVFQLTTLRKCLVTLAARKWLLSYMNPCVTLCIWHVTNRTGKWFSSPVDMFMCLQGMIMYKWFFTVGARKWLLSCTDPVMFLQFIIFFTGLVTFCRGK